MQDTFDLKDEALLKASGALTGGIGGLADTCGSMIGSTLILGSVCGCGRKDAENLMPTLGKSVKQAADFYKWFEKEKGTVNCRKIITEHGDGIFYDFNDPEQAKEAIEKGVPQKCDAMVGNNAAKAAEMIWDTLKGNSKS